MAEGRCHAKEERKRPKRPERTGGLKRKTKADRGLKNVWGMCKTWFEWEVGNDGFEGGTGGSQ